MAYHRETDVLVAGSGAAAFSAAITAKKNGADVIMLEKAALIGGTTLRSGGGYWIPNNRFQREKGIADVKEDALRYMARQARLAPNWAIQRAPSGRKLFWNKH